MRDVPAPLVTPGVPRARNEARAGTALLVLAVLLVVQVAALLWVHDLEDAAQQRRLDVIRVKVLSDSLAAGSADTVVRPLLAAAVGDLRSSGVPGAGAVERAAADSALGSDRGLAALAVAVDRSVAQADEQVVARERLELGVVLGLLIATAIGCSIAFSSLIRRERRRRAEQCELARREAQAAGEQRLQAMVRRSADVIAVLEPDSTVSFISPAASTVLGRDPDSVVGRRFAELVLPDDRGFLAHVLTGAVSVEQAVSLQVPHPDGRLLSLEGTLEDLREEPTVRGWLMTVRDVSERQALEDDLAHQALHDRLTGLTNRQLLDDRLLHALRRRESSRAPMAVLCIGVDEFTIVNDNLGHDLGDELLVVSAQRLVAALQPEDTVARLATDEFVVLLDGSDTDAATLVAHRLLAALAEPVELGDDLHQVRVSIGLAALERGADGDPHLMRNAGMALHEGTDSEQGGLAVYDDQMHRRGLQEMRDRAELADAISRGELIVHYQPTVWLESETISGFEALVRWQHPTRGLVPPQEFIGLAESTGLIAELGEWVLREACRAGASMQLDGGPSIAVNVSPLQLTVPGFGASVAAALEDSGLPPHRLALEITETVMLDDAGTDVLAELRDLGIRVAIDDFGTGFNSLAQLSALPLDVLKIDKSFVDKLSGDGSDAADLSMIDAVIAMSEALGLVTVAEGIEDVDQALWLQARGATLGQGYLWSRPVPLAAAHELLRHGVPTALGSRPLQRPAEPVALSPRARTTG